jgi:hypothetical protein
MERIWHMKVTINREAYETWLKPENENVTMFYSGKEINFNEPVTYLGETVINGYSFTIVRQYNWRFWIPSEFVTLEEELAPMQKPEDFLISRGDVMLVEVEFQPSQTEYLIRLRQADAHDSTATYLSADEARQIAKSLNDHADWITEKAKEFPRPAYIKWPEYMDWLETQPGANIYALNPLLPLQAASRKEDGTEYAIYQVDRAQYTSIHVPAQFVIV